MTEELVRRSVVTRLGRGVDAGGSLSQEGIERVFSTLEEYRRLIDENGGADTAVAVLTSAVRDAANGEEFARTVGERFGLAPHILTGDDEAKMTFLGATSERDPADETPTLVIDIGGGSTETVIGRPGREPDFHVSNQAGVVRQTERHLAHDPPQRSELDALAADVRAIFVAAVPAGAPARGRPGHRRGRDRHLARGDRPVARSLRRHARARIPTDPRRVRADARRAGRGARARSAGRSRGCIPTARRRSSPGWSSCSRCSTCSVWITSRYPNTTFCAEPRSPLRESKNFCK